MQLRSFSRILFPENLKLEYTIYCMNTDNGLCLIVFLKLELYKSYMLLR